MTRSGSPTLKPVWVSVWLGICKADASYCAYGRNKRVCVLSANNESHS